MLNLERFMTETQNSESLCILVHYSEVGLKGKNRGFFEKRLKESMKKAVSDIPGIRVRNDYGRMFIFMDDESTLNKVSERLSKVIGIAHFNIAYRGDWDVDVLKEQVYEKIKDLDFESFRINTRRADKVYPISSVKVNEIVGARVVEGMQKKVDLKNAELTCTIEIFNHKIYYSFERIKGIRGLAVGSSGKVVSLLSSGIDSPVAAYRMMTRGCKVVFVHFHSFPFTEKSSWYNTRILAEKLTQYQYKSVIYFVPLAKIQEAIILNTPPKLRIIMYRRMMYRLAEMIAYKEGAKALVTGESVGQVASQTLDNIIAISEVVNLPILRPLIGSDKEDIIEQAQKLDTFETSIEPYDDCCSYLLPKSPETHAKLDEVHEAESNIENMKELLDNAVKEADLEILYFPEK